MDVRWTYMLYPSNSNLASKRYLVTLSMRRRAPGGLHMDLRIIHTFYAPPCAREVAHGYQDCLKFHAPARARGAGAWI